MKNNPLIFLVLSTAILLTTPASIVQGEPLYTGSNTAKESSWSVSPYGETYGRVHRFVSLGIVYVTENLFGYQKQDDDPDYSRRTAVMENFRKRTDKGPLAVKTQLGLKFNGFARDLKTLSFDISAESPYFKNLLDDPDATQLTARYASTDIQCDGVSVMQNREREPSIESIVSELNQLNIEDYLRCDILLNFVSSNRTFNTDPFGDHAKYDKPAHAGDINPFFNKQYKMSFTRGINAPTTLQGHPWAFQERTFLGENLVFRRGIELGAEDADRARQGALDAATNLVSLIKSYGADLVAGTSPTATLIERGQGVERLLSQYRPRLADGILKLREIASQLSLFDLISVSSQVSKAYALVHGLEKQLCKNMDSEHRLNLDLRIEQSLP